MLFNSRVFLFAFLPVAYFVFWKLSSKQWRYVWLTISGYVFYSFWNYKFCAIMAFSTLVSYSAGLGFLKFQDVRRRKFCLIAPIAVDLSLLAFFKYFKYFNLLLSGAEWTASLTGADHASSLIWKLHLHALLWNKDFLAGALLPVGISFYTFHTISYIVDSYRGTIKPTKNIFEFACYVALFPQLVAGPIVRFRQVESDLENLDAANRRSGLDIGWSYFTIGIIKKVLIADSIAAVINPALANYSTLSTAGAWLCALGYTYQIYFDFSGYSDMAMGLGHMFGIRLPQNFNSPYKALDPSDFWRRWHISLSTCLRDYLYIPLGGNRKHVYWNLLITMLLGGLWHGANSTFVIWGAYHGVLLIFYKLFHEQWDALPALLRRSAMFVLMVLGWVLFRAESFSMAMRWLAKMLYPSGGTLFAGAAVLAFCIAIAGAIAHAAPNTFEISHDWSPQMACAMAVGLVCCLVLITGGQRSPFLYFQF
ncbi:MAG TPA: MBOAT family O-acyltransferase [Terriglobales bacterium]|nr:MBOAT family O-acyltransferase [Terriglobales bacterium]